jgi:hypothetical protein
LAEVLHSMDGYLLGETEDWKLLKNPYMIKYFNGIAKFHELKKQYILYLLDAVIKSAKLKSI